MRKRTVSETLLSKLRPASPDRAGTPRRAEGVEEAVDSKPSKAGDFLKVPGSEPWLQKYGRKRALSDTAIADQVQWLQGEQSPPTKSKEADTIWTKIDTLAKLKQMLNERRSSSSVVVHGSASTRYETAHSIGTVGGSDPSPPYDPPRYAPEPDTTLTTEPEKGGEEQKSVNDPKSDGLAYKHEDNEASLNKKQKDELAIKHQYYDDFFTSLDIRESLDPTPHNTDATENWLTMVGCTSDLLMPGIPRLVPEQWTSPSRLPGRRVAVLLRVGHRSLRVRLERCAVMRSSRCQ